MFYGGDNNMREAVNEAVRQGLVQRIDPEDPEQVRVVADYLWDGDSDRAKVEAAELLTSLAALKGGAR